jgi:drug/metabolite transporter (DMT)-like permease
MTQTQPTMTGNESAEITVPATARSPSLADAVLALITFLWGVNFFVTQIALQECRPLGLLALRFAIAAAALLLLFPFRIARMTRADIKAGGIIGLVLFGAYIPQTVGLLYIPVAKSAFITALYVPLVPALQLVFLAKAPHRAVWIGIMLAFAGLVLLSAGEGLAIGFGIGEALTLLAAVASAFQIILIGRWAPGSDPLRLAFVQIAVVAVLCVVAMPIMGEPLPDLTPTVMGAAIGLGVIGTSFILAAMNWAQQTVSPARATVIYATEPVWAASIAMFAGQWMTASEIAGSILILAGVLVSELRRSEPRENTAAE